MYFSIITSAIVVLFAIAPPEDPSNVKCFVVWHRRGGGAYVEGGETGASWAFGWEPCS